MKKGIFIGVIILIGAFFIFNFIAAHQAEKQISRNLQAEADSAGYSVQYSSISLSPFKGNIDFSDVTVVKNSLIRRANHIHIDLRYIDFLDIYFGGLKYGLQNLLSARMQLKKTSWINRETMQQFSLGSLNITFDGHPWEGLKAVINRTPLNKRQEITFRGAAFRYTEPNSPVGNFRSDSVFSRFRWPSHGSQPYRRTDSIRVENISWAPPLSLQNKYAFFIKGFGFEQDSIPISTMGFTSLSAHPNRLQIQRGQLVTDLLTLRFSGRVIKDSTWSNLRLAPLNMQMGDLSPKFKSVLKNINKLLGDSIPPLQNNISFRLVGPLSEPKIRR